MITVLTGFTKNGIRYSKGDKATFKPYDEKQLIANKFAKKYTKRVTKKK